MRQKDLFQDLVISDFDFLDQVNYFNHGLNPSMSLYDVTEDQIYLSDLITEIPELHNHCLLNELKKRQNYKNHTINFHRNLYLFIKNKCIHYLTHYSLYREYRKKEFRHNKRERTTKQWINSTLYLVFLSIFGLIFLPLIIGRSLLDQGFDLKNWIKNRVKR